MIPCLCAFLVSRDDGSLGSNRKLLQLISIVAAERATVNLGEDCGAIWQVMGFAMPRARCR